MINYNGKPIILFDRGNKTEIAAANTVPKTGTKPFGVSTNKNVKESVAGDRFQGAKANDVRNNRVEKTKAKDSLVGVGNSRYGSKWDKEQAAKKAEQEKKQDTSRTEDTRSGVHENKDGNDVDVNEMLKWDGKTRSGYDENEIKQAEGKLWGKTNYDRGGQVKYSASRYRGPMDIKTAAAKAARGSIWGINGLPANFLQDTDPPLADFPNSLGSMFINNVLKYGTFIAFQPGFINWQISENAAAATSAVGGKVLTIARDAFTGNLQFNQSIMYDYRKDVARYTRLAAMLCGLQGHGITATFGGGSDVPQKQGVFDFSRFTAEDIAYLGSGLSSLAIGGYPAMLEKLGSGNTNDDSPGYVVFYADGIIEASDTLSNQANPSPFKEQLDSLGTTSEVVKAIASPMLGNPRNKVQQSVLNYFMGVPAIPDVWANSSFEKSYSVKIKLATPSGDKISTFMNTIFPLVQLTCLAVPPGTGGFFTSPPICKVYSQGVINSEYSLITDLTIDRKMETCNDWGMPTEIDVTMTVRDLNAYLFRSYPGWFKSGMGLGSSYTTFLATLCGINVSTLTKQQKKTVNQAIEEMYFKNGGSLKSKFNDVNTYFHDFVEGMVYRGDGYVQSVKLFMNGMNEMWNQFTGKSKANTSPNNYSYRADKRNK